MWSRLRHSAADVKIAEHSRKRERGKSKTRSDKQRKATVVVILTLPALNHVEQMGGDSHSCSMAGELHTINAIVRNSENIRSVQ